MRRLGLSDTHRNPELIESNPLYKDLVEFKDVFPESVPCKLPKDTKSTRHKTNLVPGTKHCVMKQWLLPREQVEEIDMFVTDRLHGGGSGTTGDCANTDAIRTRLSRKAVSSIAIACRRA